MDSLKTPRISIIVPVYNVQKYLRKCVDSILEQSFTDFEVLLVDDGSCDGSGQICDEYAGKDNRIRVFHKENGGVSSARNVGLDNCRSEYVTFCDSDDFIGHEWIEKLYGVICSTSADLVCADATVVDENGGTVRVEGCVKGSFRLNSLQQKAEFLISYFLNGGNTGAVWKNLFKTELINKYSIRFCETCGNYAEDLGFILEYLIYCNCVEAQDITGYNYVQHEGSMMSGGAYYPKFNEVNEISKQFGSRFLSMCTDDAEKEMLSIIHYMILRPEYHKIVRERIWNSFRKELKKIKDRSWYLDNTRSAFREYPLFCRLLGKKEARRAVAYSIMALSCLKWAG